jgi:hypothetical protein
MFITRISSCFPKQKRQGTLEVYAGSVPRLKLGAKNLQLIAEFDKLLRMPRTLIEVYADSFVR